MAIDPDNNPLDLDDITPQQAGWDATIQDALEALAPQNAIHAGNDRVLEGDDGEPRALAPLGLASHTVAGLPSASPAGRMIYVSDETGGATPAFSDGTNWRRVSDRAIVS